MYLAEHSEIFKRSNLQRAKKLQFRTKIECILFLKQSYIFPSDNVIKIANPCSFNIHNRDLFITFYISLYIRIFQYTDNMQCDRILISRSDHITPRSSGDGD